MIKSRRIAWISAAVALVAVLYIGLWVWGSVRLHHRIDRLIAERSAAGLSFTSEQAWVGGFPFRLDARFTKVVLHGIPHLPDATVTAPLLTIESRPWRPRDWVVSVPQGVALTLATGGTSLGAGTLTAAIGSGPARSTDIAVAAERLSLGSPGATAAKLTLHVALPRVPPEDHSGLSMTFSGALEQLRLPTALGPLGDTVQHIALEGDVEGPVPPEPLKAALATWRDGGGTVELHRVAVDWAGLTLSADGTLALDQTMQPLAAFSATVRGWPALLDALVAAGALKPDEAAFARLGLSLLTHPGTQGANELKTPITLQNGHLYLEKAKVAKLPTIVWP